MEELQKINNKIITLKSNGHGEPTEELTPINLEILLSESIVESHSSVMSSENTYGGGFKLTGNKMTLKLDNKEYSTNADLVHFILKGSHTADGKGIFRRHFNAQGHNAEHSKMLKEKMLGDMVLNFKHKDGHENVYVVLPIFKTEHSNQNGAEILKLAMGIAKGNTRKKEKDSLTAKANKDSKKDDPLGINQMQVTSNANMSTNGFRDFETVNLTKMIKNEVPIIRYKIDNTTFLIFLSSSINVSHYALTNGKLLGQINVTPAVQSGKYIRSIKYYTNGIEVDSRKSMNCQPISDTGQIIKEINKGETNERESIDIIKQLEILTQTVPGQVIFGIIATIFLYLVIFSSMNIVYKLYKGADGAVKVVGKELGIGRGRGISEQARAAGIRGSLKPQNKGVPK